MMSAMVEVIAVTSVLTVLGAMLFMMARDADQLMRWIIRVELFFLPKRCRERLATAVPRLGYYYFGTTGDKEQDRRIERPMRLAGHVFVILALGGILFMFLFAIVVSLVSWAR